MRNQTDNRKHQRYTHNAPMVYAFQNSDLFFSATICNYCKTGMCFEAGYALTPGAKIFIMLENYSRDAKGHDISNQYRAEVKWCSPVSDSDAFFYNVGVKYRRTAEEQSG